MLSKIIFVICIYVRYTQSQYEGDTCRDAYTNSAGVCCRANDCRNIGDDLRNRRQVTCCSFNGSTPIVCCRTVCSTNTLATREATSNVKRISEQMCDLYNSIEENRPRTKRYNGHHHDHDNAPYDHYFHHWQEYRPMDHYPEPTQNEQNHYHPEPSTDRSPEQAQDEQQDNVGRESDGTSMTPDPTTKKPTAAFGHAFAIGGQDTFANEFPHMAAVGWPLRFGGFTFKCGGSLISDRFVLTAGHCLSLARDTTLSNPQPTIVRLGDQNLLDNVTDGASPVDVPISRRIPHPNYRPPNKYYDIALLEMENPIATTPLIKPVCLWTKPIFEDFSVATVTGWGTTVSGGRENSAVLQRVTLNILNTSVCEPLLQSTRNRNWQGFSEHQMCAGVLAGGKDACQGDSGGPLQIISWKRNSDNKFRKRYYLIGVTSFGRECAKPNLPGVYTRVSAFLDWIEPIVWPSFK